MLACLFVLRIVLWNFICIFSRVTRLVHENKTFMSLSIRREMQKEQSGKALHSPRAAGKLQFLGCRMGKFCLPVGF